MLRQLASIITCPLSNYQMARRFCFLDFGISEKSHFGFLEFSQCGARQPLMPICPSEETRRSQTSQSETMLASIESLDYFASESSTASARLSVTQAVWKYFVCGSMP